MRWSALLTGIVGGAAGLATAVVSYQSLSALGAEPGNDELTVPAVGRPMPAAAPRVRTRLADCVPPARLVDAACVTEVTRTVVAQPPAEPVQAGSAPTVSA